MDFPQNLSDHMPEKSDPIAHNGKQNVLVYHILQNLLKFLQGVLPAIYTSKGVTLEVNLREDILCTNKAAHSGFETQRRCHQKSKTGVSVAPKMDMCPTNFFKKKNNFIHTERKIKRCCLNLST